MASYVELMKENIIDFGKLLLEKYYLLKLDEVECMVLYKLDKYSKKYNNLLNLSELEKTMHLDKDRLGDVIASLVSKGYITLKMSEDDNGAFIEEFSLEDTYKELSYVIDNDKATIVKNEINDNITKLLKVLESKNNKPLSPIEVEIIRKWFYEYKYDIEMINEEINRVSKYKIFSISSIDRNLYTRSKETITDDDITSAQEILKRKYGKK